MLADDVLYFAREDVEAAGHDHVFLAVDDAQEAVGIANGDIAGVEPAPEGLRCLLRLVEVACHDLRAAHADFARLTIGHFIAFVVQQGAGDERVDARRMPAAADRRPDGRPFSAR